MDNDCVWSIDSGVFVMNMMMDIAKYQEVLGNPRAFIEEFCYITTKDGKFEKMKLNYPQDRMMKIVESDLENHRPIRIRVLKARQMGFSTLISALGFWWAAMNENSAYAVVAHKETSASSIFEKNKIFYDNLPKALKPKTNRFNSERISFNIDGADDYNEVKGLRSKIFFGTAGGGELFRGETILFLHKSEVAFWEDKNGILKKSLNATVPYVPFSAIIDETTANGYNEFKDSWDRSVRGEDSYTALFVGWNEMEEYRYPLEPGFKLTEKELMLQMEYDLTDEQLNWRRIKIADDYDGNELWFQQEYPLTPEEAFIASGQSVFEGETIKAGYQNCEKAKFKKDIESVLVSGKLEIWEEPEEKEVVEYEQLAKWNEEKQDYEYVDGDLEVARKYVYANYTVAIDTSGMGADWNRFSVWHNIKKKKVARFSVKSMNEEKLAAIAVEIAKYYNNAMIAPEVNFSHAICDYILDLGYKNIYLTESMARIDKKKESMEYGWSTTKASKPPLISSLRAYLNENPSAIPDKEFWYEAEYYLMKDVSKNIMGAASGHHDDIVMADAIGYFVSCSMQSKQNYSTTTHKKAKKEKLYGIIMGEDLVSTRKTPTKLRKGVYTNNA